MATRSGTPGRTQSGRRIWYMLELCSNVTSSPSLGFPTPGLLQYSIGRQNSGGGVGKFPKRNYVIFKPCRSFIAPDVPSIHHQHSQDLLVRIFLHGVNLKHWEPQSLIPSCTRFLTMCANLLNNCILISRYSALITQLH